MRTFLTRINAFALIVILTVLSGKAYTQCGPLSTPTLTNNGQNGIMFDIQALQSVNITQFGMDFDTGVNSIQIYMKSGTHVGFANNPAAWTLVGSITGWNSVGGTKVTIPITFSKLLCPGQVAGFYITSTSGGCNYSNGTAVGAVAAADANIQIKQGTGKAFSFGASFTPRTPNVKVFYSCMTSCCLPPTMSFTQETCSGSCNGTATATVGAGGIAPYTYLWNAAAGNQTTQTATGLCAGTYTVTVTDNTGCVSTGTVTVTSGGASANATINAVGPFCETDPPVTLTSVTAGGTWSGTGITNTTTGVFDPSVAGPGTYTITHTIPNPCGDIKTTTITVNPSYDATITAVGPFCVSDAAITLSAVDGGGTWSGTGITNATTGVFDPAVAGPGTFTITYTIPGLCGDTKTTSITVNASYDATITPAGPFCDVDAAVTLTAVDGGGTWSGTGITNTATGVFDPTVAGPGTYTITYSIPGGCGDTKTTTITVNPTYDATITGVGPYCEDDAAVTLVAVDGGGTWSGTGITNTTTGTFDPAVAGPGTHTITYTIAGLCGDTKTTTITVNQAYDATITGVGPYCDIDPTVTLVAVDGGGTWSGTGITNATTGVFDPATAGTGTHTITYTIVAACGDVNTTTITVNPTYDATITAVGPYCASDAPVTLVAVDGGGTWSGTGITNATTGVFDPATAGPGTHTITYTISGACGDVQTTTIVVNPLDDATITPVGTQCLGAPTTTLVAVTAGGTWTGQGITNATSGTFDPTVAGPGTHTITYTTLGACPDVNTTNILVNGPLTVQAFQDETICDGTAVNLSVTGSGGDGNLTYTWTDQAGNTAGTGTALTVTPATTTVYTVTLTDGCTTPAVTDNVTITVNPIPNVNFVADQTGGCLPLDVTFTGAAGAGASYAWNFGNGTTSNLSGTATTQYTQSGCFDVTLTVTLNGCSNTLTVPNNICVAEMPEAQFIFSPTEIDIMDTEVNFTNQSSNATIYVWDFDEGANSSEENPTHFYPDEVAGSYTVCLVASNSLGCSDTMCAPVNILEPLIYYIPNSFTPDGDEFNQTFLPIFTSGFDPFDYNLLIFNRWGEVIWESNDPNFGWDGTGPNGELVENGTYVWRVEFKLKANDSRKTETGHLNVLR